MKVYMTNPVAAKVATILKTQPDPALRTLARHLEGTSHRESRYLSPDELTAVISVLTTWITNLPTVALPLDTLWTIRQTKQALPKLGAMLEVQQRRAAGQREDSEDPDEN